MLKAFQEAIPILKQIEEAGFEAYFVGGSVRDYLLNKEIDDVDIATSATPEEIKGIFEKTVDVGIEHGTVIVLFKGQSYEVTTFRSESQYKDYRRPISVTFIRSLYEDLKRRDFTMNAIAMDQYGKLIDPFQGHEAISKNIIQTVGMAEERFSEDALRMMRAIRFVSQLSFSIDNETFRALRKYVSLLENISIERKTKEFEKLLCGKNRKKAIQLLCEAGIQRYLPGMSDEEAGIMKMGDYSCEQLHLNEMWTLLLFSLTQEQNAKISLLKEWKLSNQKMKEVEKLSLLLQKRLCQNWCKFSLYHAGKEASLSVERVFNVIKGEKIDTNIDMLKKRYDTLPIKDRAELAVTGQELMSWYSKSGGPWIKVLLSRIEENILSGDIQNEKEAIKEWLLTCNPK